MDSRTKKVAMKGVKKLSQYQKVFSGPDGQAVLADMMKAHGMMSPHPNDPHQMALKEGERLVVLRILTLLKQDPKAVLERIEHATKLDE